MHRPRPIRIALDLAALFKLRIGLAIALSAVAGMAVAPGPMPAAWQVGALALAVLLASASAGAFNHYAERDLDARMVRTRNRPFVTGRWRPGPLWLGLIGFILVLGVGSAWAVFNAMAALHIFLGAFVYGVVYTVWLKRRTFWNIVVGGLSGSFAVLAGAAAVDPAPAAVPLILALVLFLWTPPHFWSLAMLVREDYAQAGVPMLPVVKGDAPTTRAILAHAVALALLALLPALYGLGWLYLGAAAVGGAWFVWTSVALVRAPGPAAARANFLASLGQLSLLLLGAIADSWLLG
jgi:heme o synthase